MAALILITVYCLITLDGTSTQLTSKSVAYQLNFTKNDPQPPADTILLHNTSNLPENQTVKQTVFVKDVTNTRQRTYHNFDTNNIASDLIVVGERRDRRNAQEPQKSQVLPSQVLQLYPYPVFYPPNNDVPKYVEPYPRWNVVPPVFYPFPAPYPSFPSQHPQQRPPENPQPVTKKPTITSTERPSYPSPAQKPGNFYLPPAPTKPTQRPATRPTTKPTPKVTMKPITRPTPRPTNAPPTKATTVPSPTRPTPRPTVYPPFYNLDYVQQKVDEYIDDNINNINEETFPTLKTTVEYDDANPAEQPTVPTLRPGTDILDEDYTDEDGIRLQTTIGSVPSIDFDDDGFSSNRVPIFESPSSGSTTGALQIDARSHTARNLRAENHVEAAAATIIEKPKSSPSPNLLAMENPKKGLCTWAILTCCNHNINSVQKGCFQIMGCPMVISFPKGYDPCVRRTSTTENNLLISTQRPSGI